MINMTLERFLISRARSLVSAPDKKLRSPELAEKLIYEADQIGDPGIKNHFSYHRLDSYVALAQVWLTKKAYPVATEALLDVVKMSQKMHTSIHLPFITELYEEIRLSNYGKDIAVAELGLRLLLLQYPQLFQQR
ncbi:hypothetical protein EPA93_04295 [Ktedonosporobacter rubrisoli]|uniref:Uncharacterized protein n=1 Tax=Ktedonosporobacter rubrisoli TaxID=2509675 RepID=A0A4P6JKS3_KTERU|nr:hypothetical protein [Ktedonosporobacter rubrisoli]QBD75256.1 hypothetical protein EPA93_04295 [Ktedonosporobacter rubrisoli]